MDTELSGVVSSAIPMSERPSAFSEFNNVVSMKSTVSFSEFGKVLSTECIGMAYTLGKWTS